MIASRFIYGLIVVSVALSFLSGCGDTAKQFEGVRGLRSFTVGHEEMRVYAWLVEDDDETVLQGPMFAARSDVSFKFIRDYERDCFVIANIATTNIHNIKTPGVFHLKPDGALIMIHDAWPRDIFRNDTVENHFIENVVAVELRKTQPSP
jgi:hypothetical protein